MKFTTPCFVRIDNVREREKMIKWMLSIGHKHIIFDGCEISTYGSVLQDCGTDIELFKALAAMNDENDYYQWFAAVLKPEHMVFNDSVDDNRLFTGPLFRKATAEEIIEHFKNRKK